MEKRVVKLQLLLTDSELKEIDDYRYGNRVPSRSEAVRILLEQSLERWRQGTGTPEDGG
ncbi:conserved protein [Tepidicaulis marinus]|uniref:Conserved protein n=1 Tax=Tepidicaulis marinus TaxID=1333998 RepID=A0A081B7K8_9HYPH|nr:conserved protein [Tepidicaulis marinus]